jgi:hypothetical protein
MPRPITSEQAVAAIAALPRSAMKVQPVKVTQEAEDTWPPPDSWLAALDAADNAQLSEWLRDASKSLRDAPQSLSAAAFEVFGWKVEVGSAYFALRSLGNRCREAGSDTAGFFDRLLNARGASIVTELRNNPAVAQHVRQALHVWEPT